ncbi:MAG: hypothetical protein ACI8RD_001366 [Bacillariaceae sp.]|jgi:hypothetical protein
MNEIDWVLQLKGVLIGLFQLDITFCQGNRGIYLDLAFSNKTQSAQHTHTYIISSVYIFWTKTYQKKAVIKTNYICLKINK